MRGALENFRSAPSRRLSRRSRRTPPPVPSASSQVEFAVQHAGGECGPLVRGEDQRWPFRVLAVTQGDDVVAAFLGARKNRDLDAGAAVPAAVAGLAPRGAGQVHVSIAFLTKSIEARGASALLSVCRRAR